MPLYAAKILFLRHSINPYCLLINLMSQTDQNSTSEESPQNNTPNPVSRRRNGMNKRGAAGAAAVQASPTAFGEVSDLQNVTEKLTGAFPEGRPERKSEPRPERREGRKENTRESAVDNKDSHKPAMRSAPKFEEKESSKENWAPSEKGNGVKKRVRRENKPASKGLFARLSAIVAWLFATSESSEEELKRSRNRKPSGDGNSSGTRRRSGRRSRGRRRGDHNRSSQGSSRNRDNSDS